MTKLRIYIPSRARWDAMTTQWLMPSEYQKLTTIVVRPDEASQYEEALAGRIKMLVMPKGINGGSPTRQWINEYAKDRYFALLDDDLTGFCVKKVSTTFGGIKRVTNEAAAFGKAMDQCISWLDQGFAHVGVSERYMAARPSPKFYYENNRLGQFTVWDHKVLEKLGADFNRTPAMQDLDVNLQLLTKGYPSRVLTKHSYVAKPEQYRGGCSLYRSDEVKRKACDRMAKLWPGICQSLVKEKFGRTYYHVKTSWRVAKKMGGIK